ncbi:galactose mutarotase-like domain-containing protein [Geopyxis carbonaria]|nr:galactose mutarotase-like domain-containing protein [Geopyxis carbonaria]
MNLLSLSLSLLLSSAAAAATVAHPAPDASGKYTLTAPGIKAQFVPYGAGLSNLFITDKHGVARDIVLGFDNATAYTTDRTHDHYGGVPGRYANRIGNATFTLSNGKTYHVDANNGPGNANTLHGGSNGWDYRNFTVLAQTPRSIEFGLLDPAGSMGFPGAVRARVKYWLTARAWHIEMTATSLTELTPIMLSSHVYWNLDGFANPSTADARGHTLHLPYSGLRIAVDDALIPTGELLPNTKGGFNDLWSGPKRIGAGRDSDEAKGNCGTGCTGYDNAYLVAPHDVETEPVAVLRSPWSGIGVSVFSEQEAFQVYGCEAQSGTAPIKKTQGRKGGPRTVVNGGCVVLEVEDWIDAINHPEWMREKKQVFGPGETYKLTARYEFDTVK